MSRGDGTKQTSTASKDLSIPLQSIPPQCHPTAAPCRRVLHTSRPRCNRCNRKKRRMKRRKRLTHECRRSWRRRCKGTNATCFRALFFRALWSSMMPDAPSACRFSALSCFLMHFVLFLHAPCLCLCIHLVLFALGYSKEVVFFHEVYRVTTYYLRCVLLLHATCTVSCYCMCALPLSLGLLLATKEPAC